MESVNADVDPRLRALAVSHWPPTVAMTVLAVMVLALVARAVTVKQSRFERCGYIAVVLWLGVIALRETVIQSFLGHLGINLATVRLMTHACAVLGGSALIVLALAWRDAVRVNSVRWSRRILFVYSPAVACIVAMTYISLPALRSNQAVELFPSRVFLYSVLYAAVPIIGAAFAGTVAARAALAESQMRGSRVIFAMCCFVAGTSVLDHSLRIWTAWKTSHTTEPELTRALMERSASTDLMLVIPVGIVLLSLMPVVVVSVARKLSSDSSTETLRRIRPFWEQLVAVFPDIRLNRAQVLNEPEEELHRLLIEVEDALMLLTQWMTDRELTAESLDDRLNAVVEALGRRENGDSPLHKAIVLPWMSDEQTLLELADRDADSWERRYNLP